MELIIIIVTIIAIIVIYSMMNVKIKELKAIALNKELNEIAKNVDEMALFGLRLDFVK